MEQDLTPAGHPETFVAWDSRSATPVAYHLDHGYAQDGVDLTLAGTYAYTLANGTMVACRPALALLQELAAQYAPERSEALTWVPAADVRQAVRLFATEQPSYYFTWAGLEEHTNATQTSRAVSLFYALTGQFDRRGSNVLFASSTTNPITGRGLLPKEQTCHTLGYAERPLGPPGTAGQVTAHDMYRAILTVQPYPVKGLITFGTDVLMENGDPLRGKAALEALDFYVHAVPCRIAPRGVASEKWATQPRQCSPWLSPGSLDTGVLPSLRFPDSVWLVQEDTAMPQHPQELPPPMPKDPNYVAPPRDPERPGPYIVAEVIPIEDQLKMGHVQGFTVRCDESERVGGKDTAPSPLGYFTVAVGF